MNRPRSILVTLLTLLLAPALMQAGDGPKTAKITYDEHVRPILFEKCLGCHSADKMRGGLAVSSYSALMSGGSSGEVVKPGDPDSSRLFQLVSHKQEPKMPPKTDRIPDASLETIKQWIAGGALENAGSKAKPANKPKVDVALSGAIKGKPAGPPPMPTTRLNLDPIVRTARASAVTALASSPWAPLLAVGGQKQVLLYHSDTMDLLGVLSFPEGVPNVLKFSRNGSLLLAAGGRGSKLGKAVVWNVQTGERLFEVGEESDSVLAADISSDQSQIALAGPGKIVRVYSTKDGQLLREIKKHTDWVTALEFSPDGVLLATGDRSGGLFVWEAFTGREYFTLRAHTAMITDLSWRADSNVLASSSEDTTIRLWEMENGGNIKGWGAHGGGVAAVHYSKDGRIVSCGRDRVAKIWDQNGAQQRVFEAFPDIALKATFTHDGACIVCGDWTGQLRVWRSADGKHVANLTTNPASATERLALLTQEVATRQAAQPNLTAAVGVSQAAAQKTAQELALMRQAFAATPLGLKAATDLLNGAKAHADRMQAELAAVQAQVTARDVYAKALADAAARVKDAADKAKDNKELAAAAAKARDLAVQASAELAASQKLAAEKTAAVQAAGAAFGQAQQQHASAAAASATSTKMLETLTAQANAAAAKAAADKAALDENTAALANARAQLDRLKTYVATAKQTRP